MAGELGNWTTINYLNVPRFDNVSVLSRSTIIYTFGGYPYTATPNAVERSTYTTGWFTYSLDHRKLSNAFR